MIETRPTTSHSIKLAGRIHLEDIVDVGPFIVMPDYRALRWPDCERTSS